MFHVKRGPALGHKAVWVKGREQHKSMVADPDQWRSGRAWKADGGQLAGGATGGHSECSRFARQPGSG